MGRRTVRVSIEPKRRPPERVIVTWPGEAHSSHRGSSQVRKTSMDPLVSLLGIFTTLTVVLAVFLLAYWYHGPHNH